jgi:hypothetical protein
MGEFALPFALVLAGVVLAAAIVHAARTIAIAIGRRREAAPLSAAGFPVEPSGIPVELETPLEIGSTVLAFAQGRWWRAEVTALEGEECVRIHYTAWEPTWDETVPRSKLQVDLGTAA